MASSNRAKPCVGVLAAFSLSWMFLTTPSYAQDTSAAPANSDEKIISQDLGYTPSELRAGLKPVPIVETTKVKTKVIEIEAPLCHTPPELAVKLKSDFSLDINSKPVITNYVEVRDEVPEITVPMFAQPLEGQAQLAVLHSGDILKLEQSPAEYEEKLRADRQNVATWLKVTVKTPLGKKRVLWFIYSPKDMDTLTQNELPFEVTLRPPRKLSEQALYGTPGFWSEDDCKRDPAICPIHLERNSRLYILETKLLQIEQPPGKTELWKLFYKLAVYTLEDGLRQRRGLGWIDPSLWNRRADPEPACLVATNEQIAQTQLVEKIRQLNESKLFALSGNRVSPEKRKKIMANLGIDEAKLGGMASLVDLTLGVEGHIGGEYIQLMQPFAGPEWDMEGVRLGLAVYSNLFVDLQVRAGLDVTTTFGSNQPGNQANLIDSEEWLIYTSPWSIYDVPIKIGLGGYYMSLLSKKKIGGFGGFVGPQSQVILEGDKSAFALRLAPVAQDLGINLQNRLFGGTLSFKLPWKVQEHSFELNLEYRDLYFKNSATKNSTNMHEAGINLVLPLDF